MKVQDKGQSRWRMLTVLYWIIRLNYYDELSGMSCHLKNAHEVQIKNYNLWLLTPFTPVTGHQCPK